jgi:DNA-binding winged helix-turn-helix (wHTH) protein/tetratricopeptide (TPR) repeat protein
MSEPSMPEHPRDFTLGEWLVRPASGEVEGASSAFRLEPKVMEVLVYLAERPGRVVTKEELLDNVWKDAFVADGALFRHISELRRRLGDDSRTPRIIETIPKRGYRLVATVAPVAPAATSGRARAARPTPTSATRLRPSPSARLPAPPEVAPDAAMAASRPTRRLLVPALSLVALVAVSLTLLLRSRPDPARAPAPTDRPRLAVLYFENASDDPTLDWLRSALADMLVSGLAQSPALEVLGTDRLFQILRGLKRLDERAYPPEVVKQVAKEAGSDRVVQGSFARVGTQLRLKIQLLDGESGEVLLSEAVDGPVDAQLFSLVDELGRRIRVRLAVPSDAAVERDLKDITTSSLEAYRYYAEGIRLHLRFQPDEARVMFEKAITIDPGFAMALAKLSVVHHNIGQDRKSAEYAERALANLQRLSPRERYSIQGWYYVRREETIGRAVDAYSQAIATFPDFAAARANLGAALVTLERYGEALIHFEELFRQRFPGFAPYLNASKAYEALGRFADSEAHLVAFRERQPDNAAVHRSFGFNLLAAGKLDEALAVLERSRALDPPDLAPEWGRFVASVLREDWDTAAAASRTMSDSGDPYWRWSGLADRALVQLFRGRSRDALESLAAAVASQEQEPGELSALSRIAAARVRLLHGDAARARAEALKAQQEAPGNPGEWHGLFVQALAEEALGRTTDADRTAARLGDKAAAIPSDKEKRRHRHLLGELLLRRGDPRGALVQLNAAVASLAPRGTLAGSELPQHVPIWFSLGSAHLAAGDAAAALPWLEKVIGSGYERLHWPVPYVQSHYLRARALESLARRDEARASYARFVALWGEGDLDRAALAEARRKSR